jgi:hypothetical protein
VFILKGVKVVCFDTLLQVLILKGLTGAQKPHKKGVVFLSRRQENWACWGAPESKNASRDAGATEHEACYYPPLMVRNK